MRAHQFRLLAASLLVGFIASLASAQMTPDQQAAQILDGARRAYNEKNYPFAAQRLREFLQKFGNHKDAPAARYGLALCLLDGPEKDYANAINELQPLVGNQQFADRPFAIYYLGLSQRGLGLRALAQANAKPQEAPQHQAAARQKFEEAIKQFAGAAEEFTKRVKEPDIAKELPIDLEWASRARCDQAEMLLRVAKYKEAQAAVQPLLDEVLLQKSRYHKLGLYHHGFAAFLLKDRPAAAKSLGKLAPFTDPVHGTHARYLLARIHHLDNERQEALVHYQGVLADHEKLKLAAAEELRQPERIKNDPDEKARLEALVKGAPAEHIARAHFFLGVLQYENGQFADALQRFTAFLQQYPQTPLTGEVQLRQGFCQVQLRMWADAQKTLAPLADKEPRLGDQALLWLGKAQVGAADPANKQAYDQALKTAIETYRKAADRANALVNSDPEARGRRGECLVELADAQQAAGLHRDAAGTYNQVINEKLLPPREEELTHSLVTAQQLAGDYGPADQTCAKFVQTFPKSTLLPAILFRQAENAYFQLLAAEKANNAGERAKLTDEVIKRYQALVEKFPDSANVNTARYGLAVGLHRKGEIDKALERLDAIPQGDRGGELAVVPYLIADCLLRLAPAKADDALAAGKLEEQMKKSVENLEAFISSSANHPQAADALIKLGHCQIRLAELQAQEPEKAKNLAAARTAYEQLLQRFPKSDLQPMAAFERGKVLALQKDVNGAINELRRFTQDPLKQTSTAPLAVLALANLLRTQNQAQAAADALAACRQLHEPKLTQNPATIGLVPLLQYQQGVALREAGKRADARQLLQQVFQAHMDKPEGADAGLRAAQCLKDDGLAKIAEGQKKLAIPNLPQPDATAARKLIDDGLNELRQSAQTFAQSAEQLKGKQPAHPARARMLYEAAWTCRNLADFETDAARSKMQQELWQKKRDELAKKLNLAANQQLPQVPLPEIARSAIPIQPGEQQARAHYQALIAAFPDLAINADARFELAELLSDRNEHEPAEKLLREAIDKEPPAELADKIRVRLGACLIAKATAQKTPEDGKKFLEDALKVLTPVANNAKSAMVAQAIYRAGEAQLLLGDVAEATKRFSAFRDQAPFQNLPGLTDRALLRLGHALAQQKQWEPSRQALEQIPARFPTSLWVNDARYAAGWAYQNLGQYDNAVNAYQQVINAVATELAARAQLNIGVCRLAQKRYPDASTALLVVPYTYDYPNLSALALLEAARAFTENKQEGQAVRLLERVLRDHPESEHAEAAKAKLAALKRG